MCLERCSRWQPREMLALGRPAQRCEAVPQHGETMESVGHFRWYPLGLLVSGWQIHRREVFRRHFRHQRSPTRLKHLTHLTHSTCYCCQSLAVLLLGPGVHRCDIPRR
jgi:hypothetical protein